MSVLDPDEELEIREELIDEDDLDEEETELALADEELWDNG